MSSNQHAEEQLVRFRPLLGVNLGVIRPFMDRLPLLLLGLALLFLTPALDQYAQILGAPAGAAQAVSRTDERLEDVRAVLAALPDQPVGFVSDRASRETLFQTQYALAPIPVVPGELIPTLVLPPRTVELERWIGVFDDPAAAREAEARLGLVRDREFPGGVVLLRREG